MHDALRSLLEKYECRTREDSVNALREILQQLALLGLWRGKFFEHAAFYGGTALRILYGLDHYSEDLDFSLLRPDPDFALGEYGEAVQREIQGMGFDVEFTPRTRSGGTPIESAFLKTNTFHQLMVIGTESELLRDLHPGKSLKIKIEVDTDPPGGFETEERFLLLPVPFSVRTYRLPDLFAGKMHAILCRRWKSRVKGRDWYDLVWYIAHHPRLHLSHLEERMRQSGDLDPDTPLTPDRFRAIYREAVYQLDVEKARADVAPYVRDPGALEVWSREFFEQIGERIEVI